ncbi:agip98 [Agrotis ipsilon multiple nucleopolyhedrovirus]|uniref:Ac78 n=1 Tax=Agrotis ipsilon multiple nucleopolyhedrovirus TaxID=208013 RepID=B6D612_9ABAC|nr:agip98 [Agrotis ipsilon multiple nucleopolyhedrovirus]ACI28799.1 unknown [Agrotis ipsilon multiple nucleopolyhedrovirus]
MSLDVPYERLGATTKVDYIPLKLALNDLTDNGVDGGGIDKKTDPSKNRGDGEDKPKIDINVRASRETPQAQEPPATKQQMYDALVVGMLTFFCILVLLYAIYYFVILRDRQKSIVRPSYMF